jgi:hypothetical protein
MTIRSDIYPEGLIRAIDRWQAGSKDKARKARMLWDWSRHLPPQYRALPTTVFRQVRVNARLGIGMAVGVFLESISSWTTSHQVAQRFRQEDGDREKVLMIFARHPAADDIIINLNALYADPDFMETVRATSARLDKTFRGIERWKGSQEEVVLKETTIANDEIVSLGAFRQISDVVPLVGTRDPNAPSDEQIFRELTGKTVDEHFWTSRESAATGVRNVADRVHAFLAEKRLWPNDLTQTYQGI